MLTLSFILLLRVFWSIDSLSNDAVCMQTNSLLNDTCRPSKSVLNLAILLATLDDDYCAGFHDNYALNKKRPFDGDANLFYAMQRIALSSIASIGLSVSVYVYVPYAVLVDHTKRFEINPSFFSHKKCVRHKRVNQRLSGQRCSSWPWPTSWRSSIHIETIWVD